MKKQQQLWVMSCTGRASTSGTGMSALQLVGKQKRKGAQNKKKLKCYSCGENGHFWNECPHKDKSNNGAGSRNKMQLHSAKTVKETSNWCDGEGACTTSSNVFTECWIVDSCDSIHMTPRRELMSDYSDLESPEKVAVGDGRTVDATGKGNTCVNVLFEERVRHSIMYDMLYIPDLKCSLYSVRAAAQNGNEIASFDTECHIQY